MKDSLLGYQRWSAYDLSETRLREAAVTLLDFQPSWVIGYSVALDQFARVNQDLQSCFHALKLKVAIATAESFPRSDSAQLVSHVLGCPVAMEYGAVETGPIAHQKLVTSLYSRCLPLVRYKIGDAVSADVHKAYSLSHFKSVTGRCNDFVQLRNSAQIHSEAFSHVVKDFSSVVAYQVSQSKDGLVKLYYVGPKTLESYEIAEIRQRLKKIHADLEGIPIGRVESLEKTIAVKTRRIFRE